MSAQNATVLCYICPQLAKIAPTAAQTCTPGMWLLLSLWQSYNFASHKSVLLQSAAYEAKTECAVE